MALLPGREESAHEALSQGKQTQQDLASIRAEVERLRCVVQAMWEIVRQDAGADDAQLREAANRIQEQSKKDTKVAAACPECGRALQARSNFCIYCGAKVERDEIF